MDLQSLIIIEIKKHVYNHQLKPGDILPSQSGIAKAVGASRASVREAIKTMEAQGLLRVLNGKGIFVENVDTSFYAGEMNRPYILQRLIDALSVRKALEGMAVEQCTLRASDEQLRGLSEILSKVEARYERREPQADLDLLFHQTLVSLAGNVLLTHMLKNLLQASSGIWSMEDDELTGILSGSIPAHRAMMNRMLARDVQGAVKVHDEYMRREITLLSEIETRAARAALEISTTVKEEDCP